MLRRPFDWVGLGISTEMGPASDFWRLVGAIVGVVFGCGWGVYAKVEMMIQETIVDVEAD